MYPSNDGNDARVRVPGGDATLRPTVPRWAGVPVCLLAGVVAFSAMLADPPPGSAAAFATCLAVVLGVVTCSVGMLLSLGTFAVEASDDVTTVATSRALRPGLLQVGIALGAMTLLVHFAAVGSIPSQPWVMAIGLPLTFALAVHGAGRVLTALEPAPDLGARQPRAVFRACGTWLLILTGLLYLPMLGNFGLIDPWESEYAEVARGMLSRGDWISLWWGDQGWFFSKPILDFALMAASLVWFGVDHRPDQMIVGVATGRLPQPEWAVRFPVFVLSLLSVYVLYRSTTSAIGRRAAFFGGLILITTPYWFFLTRQVMTDMAYMAPMAAALGFMIIALNAKTEARAPSRVIRCGSRLVGVSTYHILLLAILGLGLVQILYLLSRHVSIDFAGPGVSIHRDQVFEGSPGNCHLPGNAACLPAVAANAASLQPAVAALVWAGALGAFCWRTRNERRIKELAYLAMWLCIGLAFLGKAAPGFVLPFATLLAVTLTLGRPAELLRCHWLNAGLLFAAIVAPWFVQAYARHGDAFFERLFLHDMYQRAFGHVHDTNTGDDTSFRYYVWQLGYGLFPWSGLIAGGVLWCIGKSSRAPTKAPEDGTRIVTFTFTLWLLATFGLFGIAGTKFHHYIAPLVPGAAMLGGAALDAWWKQSNVASGGLIALLTGTLLIAVTRDLATTDGSDVGPARLLYLFTYLYTRPWPSEIQLGPYLGVLGTAAVLGSLGFAVAKWQRGAILWLMVTAFVCSAWCLTSYLPVAAPHWGQRETIATYYRERRSPDELLVAYAQNWMGENFYTGNHVATFKVPGSTFKKWVDERRKSGALTFFVTTEHGTIPRLRRDLGDVRAFDVLTTSQMNNKFALARVAL